MMGNHHRHEHGGDAEHPGWFYSSPQAALMAPHEEFLYVACLHEGTGVDKPDFLAVVDTNSDSNAYATVIHELDAGRRRGQRGRRICRPGGQDPRE
jgi:hypothetical protein